MIMHSFTVISHDVSFTDARQINTNMKLGETNKSKNLIKACKIELAVRDISKITEGMSAVAVLSIFTF